MPNTEDNIEIVDTGYSTFMPLNKSNYSIGGTEKMKEDGSKPNIVFSQEIGLAIEPPPNGMSLE